MSKFTKETELQPTLVRVKRAKGTVVQPCDLYISKECCASGWSLPKSKWYKRSLANDPEEYIDYIKSKDELCGKVYELVGQTLGCWCAGTKAKSCHGQVLIDETKEFLKQYFEKFKKENRSLDSSSKSSKGVRMDIVPQLRYKLKVASPALTTKKYKIRVVKRKRKKSASPLSSPVPSPKKQRSKCEEDSKGPVILWSQQEHKWILPEGYSLTDDYRIPMDATIRFEKSSTHFDLKKGDKVTKDGKVSIYSLITNKELWVKKDPIPHKPPPIDFERDYTIKFAKKPVITQSAVGDLFTGKRGVWGDPFVCRVEARLFNKKTNRYMLKLFDGMAMYKVQLGSQLFEVIKEQFIDKGDHIQVIDYASTAVSSRKRIVILYTIKKVIY
jgi:hypothetical protein